MNILLLNKSHTYPPSSGSEVRTWKTAEKFAELGEVWLAGPDNEADPYPGDIHPVHLRTPLLRKHAREQAWYAGFLLSSRHPLQRLLTDRVVRAVTQQTEGVDFDLVVSEAPQLLVTARRLSERHDAKLLLNKHNAYYEFLGQYLEGWPAPVRERAVANLRAYEQRAIDGSWATVFQSSGDIEAFDIPAGVRVSVIPNGCDYEAIAAGGDPEAARAELGIPADRPVALFVGSFDYDPNGAAAETIIEHVAPEFPEVTFLLVGRNPPPVPPERDNVYTPGFVDDLPGTLGLADIALCPLPRGSGTKLKMMDYLAAGLPIVTTTVGAQGLPITDGENALVRDTVGGTVDAVRTLLVDDATRQRLADSAAELGKSYAWSTLLEGYEELLAEVHND